MYMIPLLPNGFKKPGLILILTGLATWFLAGLNGYQVDWLNMQVLSLFNRENDSTGGFAAVIQNNVLDEIVALTLLAGCILTGFSRQKQENEFTMAMRHSAIMWAVLVNSLLVFLGEIFIYDFAFLKLQSYNMFTVLLIYITRFYYLVYKSTKAMHHGK